MRGVGLRVMLINENGNGSMNIRVEDGVVTVDA